MIEEHRETVLLRTKVAAWIAAFIIPFTIFSFFGNSAVIRPDALWMVTGLSLVGVAAVLLSLRMAFFRRHYSVPFFVLVGIVCAGTEAVLLQLAGGSSRTDFFFPYFVILFGIATLFPASVAWAIAATIMCPVTFLLSELLVRGELERGAPRTDLLLLIDYSFIAFIGNRVTTRLFFSEIEHRMALEHANTKLREMDRARADLLAGITHDLRNPLNNIIAPLTALSTQVDDVASRTRRFIDIALRGATRMEGMLTDLLELSRLESAATSLHLQHVDLNAILATIVETTKPFAASRGYTLEFKGPDAPVWIVLDPGKIERVVMNLVSNALNYSPPETQVTVLLRDYGSNVSVYVTDQGPGIAPADLERIFERFTRLEGPTTSSKRGSGLGLALVKEFVEMHHGEIQVQSELGKGTTFIVVLPRLLAEDRASTRNASGAGERPS